MKVEGPVSPQKNAPGVQSVPVRNWEKSEKLSSAVSLLRFSTLSCIWSQANPNVRTCRPAVQEYFVEPSKLFWKMPALAKLLAGPNAKPLLKLKSGWVIEMPGTL